VKRAVARLVFVSVLMMKRALLLAVAAAIAVACSSSDDDTSLKLACHLSDGDCYCSAFKNGSAPASNPTCSESALPDTVCCAEDGWPGTGQPTHNCVCVSTKETCQYPNHVTECSLTSSTSSSSSSTSSSSSSGSSTPQCTSDSSCSGHCSGSCYRCRSGGCICGYKGTSGACIF